MAWIAKPNCSSCQHEWQDVTLPGPDWITIFCESCHKFTTKSRIPYTHRLGGCSDCGSTGSHRKVDNENAVICPKCGHQPLLFMTHTHVLLTPDLPPLLPGQVVDATLDEWAIRIPDLPAIPIENLEDHAHAELFTTLRLKVTAVPDGDSDSRAYFFRLLDK